MKKRVLLGAAVSALALTTAAFAGGPDHMAMPVDNSSGHFFVGLAAGMGMLNASQTTSSTTSYTDSILGPVSLGASLGSKIGSNSFLGGLLLGYGTVLSDNLYVGVAGNLLYNSLSSNVHTATFTATTAGATSTATIVGNIRNSFQGGADLRLGMKVDSATPYILGGFEGGSWKYSAAGFSNTKTLWAPKVGLGVLFDINSNWNAGLEYAYSWFSNLTSTGTSTTTILDSAGLPTTATTTASNTVKVGQNQVLASINYLF